MPRIQKPQKRIAINAIAGIKNHIISHNLKATPIPAKQLETLHMPDLVQLKEKKRKNSKKKTESSESSETTAEISEKSKTEAEAEEIDDTCSEHASLSSLPDTPVRFPSDDISEDANFCNQDPELLSQIFFKKALTQPSRSRQLAEISRKLSYKVDGFLPCLLRQLQKQYSEWFEEG